MVIDKREADVALEVARELQDEYGQAVVAEVEKRLVPDQGRRTFEGIVSAVAAVASVIIGCIQVYLQYRSDKKQDDLRKRMEEDAPSPDQLTEEQRLRVITVVLARLTDEPKDEG